jgi:hypothetical protein
LCLNQAHPLLDQEGKYMQSFHMLCIFFSQLHVLSFATVFAISISCSFDTIYTPAACGLEELFPLS